MNPPVMYESREITVYIEGAIKRVNAPLVYEVPITIFLNNKELITMICSPGSHQELAAGFLLCEGLVQKRSDIKDIIWNEPDGLLSVQTTSPTPQTDNFLRRHIASCCGKGRAGLYFVNDANQLRPVQSACQFNASHLLDLIRLLDEKSDTFRLTGGVHSAALASSTGLLARYEDIGRHNAVDKVLGYALLNEIDTSDKCLVLSGRVASEILIKAARGGIPLVLSRSAPTVLTVEMAEDLGITVVGFARGQRFNVYTHLARVKF